MYDYHQPKHTLEKKSYRVVFPIFSWQNWKVWWILCKIFFDISCVHDSSQCFKLSFQMLFHAKKKSLFKVSQHVLVQISKNLLRHSVYCTQACHKYKNVYPKKGIQYDPFFACRYKHGRGFYVCFAFSLPCGLPSKSSAELSCVKNAASLYLW